MPLAFALAAGFPWLPWLLCLLCHGVIGAPAPPAPPAPALNAPAALAALQQQQHQGQQGQQGSYQGSQQGAPQAVLQAPPQPPSAPSISPSTAKRKLHGKFLHVTDFHPDEFYKVHTSTAEDDACHRGNGPAGTYGAETSDCDTPMALVNATFDWIAAHLADDIDFVVWTGDSARHDSDEAIPRSPAQVLGTNRLLADKFAEVLARPGSGPGSGPGGGLAVPVVPTLGNNDILPHNILLPGPNRWLSRYADLWRRFVPEEQRHGFEFGGWFYVEVVPGRLAVFSLNTLYLFDRNAGVDGCASPSEPGFRQMEWLRVQLAFMRRRGVKVLLAGHVPPARTDSKMLWDETCWQRYALWLRQYRDVVVGGLYGHMNIDHFLLQDAEEIDIVGSADRDGDDGDDDVDVEEDDHDNDSDDDDDDDEPRPQGTVSVREAMEDELTVESATDYLQELRQGWAKLPKPVLYGDYDHDDDDDVQFDAEKNKKKKKGKKDKDKKKKKHKKKLGGKWAERYQLSFVSPSIVPNYFPTLRVVEYNITGLEDATTWADWTEPLPVADDASGVYDHQPQQKHQPWGGGREELELRHLATDAAEAEGRKKKKKNEKPRNDDSKKDKGKGDPDLVVPERPDPSAPPGPAYSPQPLTLTRWVQYYANLTHINNDITDGDGDGDGDDEADPKADPDAEAEAGEAGEEEVRAGRWREGKHGGKRPQRRPARPRAFGFEVEYATDEDPHYALPDLTVRSLVELAYRMGEKVSKKKAAGGGEDVLPDLDLRGDDADEEPLPVALDGEEVGAESKKKKGKKGEKHSKKKQNRAWLHFLRHAFVSTVDEDDLRRQFD